MIPPSSSVPPSQAKDAFSLQQSRAPQITDKNPQFFPEQQSYQEQVKQAYNPQEVQPTTVDPDIQRKIDIAKGKGLHVNPALVQATHGEQIMLQYDNGYPMPCKYCQVNPCYGMRWIFDEEVRFKCGTCGKNQKLGYTGTYAEKNKTNLDGWERAEYNRRALWRDQDAQAQEQMRSEFNQYAMNPNSHMSMLRNPNLVQSAFFE